MRKLACGLVVLLLCAAAVAEPRGPSTPEERQRAVAVIRQLEESPLSPALKQDRDWIFQWIKEVPDVNSLICTELIRPLLSSPNTPERNALTLQSMLASAAFSMEHPDAANDPVALLKAGTEGMLRAYENMLKQDPAKKMAFMEELREKKAEGQLTAYVEKGAVECGKRPETRLNP